MRIQGFQRTEVKNHLSLYNVKLFWEKSAFNLCYVAQLMKQEEQEENTLDNF